MYEKNNFTNNTSSSLHCDKYIYKYGRDRFFFLFFLLKFLNCTILTHYTYIVGKNKFYLHRNISQRFAFLNVSKTPTDKKSLKYINNIHIILYINPHEVTCNL
jgi:hypothetical protein